MVHQHAVRAMLLLVIVVAHLSTTTAEELVLFQVGQVDQPRTINPVWTWSCQSDRCEKQLVVEGETAQALDACKLLCGEYRVLWPKPTGLVQLGTSIAIISQHAITAELSRSGRELSPKVAELFRGATKLFRDNVVDLGKGVGPIRSVGRSLLIEATITDTETASFKSNTDESYRLEISETTNGRGILLDTARNFISVESIKRTLNGMAASKLNTFHWHITDSHSFPFEVESYPQLTQYGAYTPSKVFTPADIRTVVEYARVRGVRVVPEFDAPAHVGEGWQWAGPNVTVCVKAEPWTSYCVEPPCGQLNPTNGTVYEILGEIYKEMFKLFDSDIFHMGGDEVNFNCWNSTEEIVTWLSNKGLGRQEEDFLELWDEFQTKALNKVEEANGGASLPIVLWTSGLTGKGHVEKYLDKERYIIQIWTTGSDELIGELVNKGYRIIVSNYDALYFDCGFGAWVGEGNNWCSPYIGWQKVYMNSPYDIVTNLGVNLTSDVRAQILGSEATLWTEQVDDSSVDGRLWPRSSAMAERLWSNPAESWREAEYRMLHHRERLVQRECSQNHLNHCGACKIMDTAIFNLVYYI